MANTIALKGDFVRKEGEASGAITPGHLVEFGGSNDLQVHGTAGGNGRRAFALENDLVGDGIADAYAAGDTVQYGVFVQGAEVNAILQAAATCTKGDMLESAGDGTLQPTSAGGGEVIAWAMETVTVAGSRVTAEVA